MSYEIIISRSKKIESNLVRFGAEGKGLHEKLSSIETKLSEVLVKKIRFVASVRNKLLHDDECELTTEVLSDFQSACDEIDSSLASHLSSDSTSSSAFDWAKLQNSTSHSSSDSTSKPSSNKSDWDKFKEASTLKKVGIVVSALALLAFINR